MVAYESKTCSSPENKEKMQFTLLPLACHYHDVKERGREEKERIDNTVKKPCTASSFPVFLSLRRASSILFFL